MDLEVLLWDSEKFMLQDAGILENHQIIHFTIYRYMIFTFTKEIYTFLNQNHCIANGTSCGTKQYLIIMHFWAQIVKALVVEIYHMVCIFACICKHIYYDYISVLTYITLYSMSSEQACKQLSPTLSSTFIRC